MIFNVIDFGALGDGKTDCTKAIQSALDKAAETGGRVLVPPGNYLTGKLKMHGVGVRLEGTSAWGFGTDGASTLILNTDDASCLLDVTGAFGGTVSGICMNGGNKGSGIHGIYLYWEKYNGGGKEDTIAVDDCRIGGFTGNGIHFEHVWCFSLRHSMIHRNKGCGLYIDGWDAFIIDNWFTANGNGGIFGNLIASITCTGNRVEWNSVGGFILPRGDSYNITGNFFDRSFGPAIMLGAENGGVDTVTVTGNIFRRSGAYYEGNELADDKLCSHVYMKNCTGTVISGNAMKIGRNDDGKGAVTPKYAFIVSSCKDTVIDSNTMHNGATEQLMVIEEPVPGSLIINNNVGIVAK